MLLRNVFLLFLLVSAAGPTRADESYQQWLKYDRIADRVARQQYLHSAHFTAGAGISPMLQACNGELQCGLLGGLPGQAVSVVAAAGSRTSGIVLRVDKQTNANKQSLKAKGYSNFSEKNNLIITGRTNQEVLYGAFAPLLPPTHPSRGQMLSQSPLAQVIIAYSPRTYSDRGHCNLR